MIASSEFMQTLAWSLLHFLWQGAAIAALAASVMLVFRTPSARYLVGVGALALMLVSFGVTFALLSSAAGGGEEILASSATAAALVSPLEIQANAAPLLFAQQQVAIDSEPAFLWVARLWLVGVCVLALRLAFGLLLLEHLRRRNLVALPRELVAKFRALQRRLGIERVVRYCECHLVGTPAVIGFFRPIVLLPVRALTGLSEAQLEAVIAHELGHIKRFDVAVNFFQVAVETLFFFHPAVWWLNKRIRADREDCCDDIAVAASGANVGYARALATMAEWRDVPQLAMAATGGSVAARVARLLGVNHNSGVRNAGVVTASLVLMAALIAGAASLGFAQQALAQVDAPEPVKPPAPVNPPSPPAPAAKPVPKAKDAPAAKPAPAAPAAAPRASAEPRGPSYVAQMKSAGLGELDVDQLIALKHSEVTPEYIREVRASGLNPDIDQLIAMKMHGADAEYLKGMKALGFSPDLDELIEMKVHDITPEYIKQMRDSGLNPDAEEIVAMKVHDVTPEYVKEMRGLGFKADLEEVVAMKVHGIDAEYVKGVRAQGENPDAEEIVAMKIHEVTPEYRRMLESAGFKLELEDVIHAKVMDITPEFIAQVRAHGFKDLDIDQLIQLKSADVL